MLSPRCNSKSPSWCRSNVNGGAAGLDDLYLKLQPNRLFLARKSLDYQLFTHQVILHRPVDVNFDHFTRRYTLPTGDEHKSVYFGRIAIAATQQEWFTT